MSPQPSDSPETWNPFDPPNSGQQQVPKRTGQKIVICLLSLLGGATILACGGFAFRAYNAAQNRPTLAGGDATAVPPDNPSVRRQNAADFRAFYEQSSTGPGFDGVSTEDRQKVEAAIATLSDTLDDDAAFDKLFDKPRFWQAVRDSGQLSRYAVESFYQFEEFRADGAGFSSLTSPALGELVLKGVVRQGDQLVAQTYLVDPERFAKCIFWYLNDDGGELKLFDWQSGETNCRHSEYRAREFSGTFTDPAAYDNYLVYNPDRVSELPKEKAALGFAQLLSQRYPKQLQSQITTTIQTYAYISTNYELAISLGDQLRRSGQAMPQSEWTRIRAMDQLQRWDEAFSALDAYIVAYGPEPRVKRQQSFMLYNLGRVEEAVDAGIARLEMLPEQFDGTMLGGATPDQVRRIAEIVDKQPDSALLAVSISADLQGRELGLVKALLAKIDTSTVRTSEAAAIRAWLAQDQGEDDEVIIQYAAAMELAESDADRVRWFRDWCYAMGRAGRAEEAIRAPHDPGRAFEYLATGDVISAEDRMRYEVALADAAVPEDRIAKQRLRATREYVEASKLVSHGQPDEAWGKLTSAWEQNSRLDAMLAEEEGEREREGERAGAEYHYSYLRSGLRYSIARTATQLNKIEEAYAIFRTDSEDAVLRYLLSECVGVHDSTALKAFAGLHRGHSPGSPWHQYIGGVLALRAGNDEVGRSMLLRFIKAVRRSEENPYPPNVWHAQTLLVRDAVSNGTWGQLFDEIGVDETYETVLSSLRDQNRQEDRAAVLDVLEQRDDFSRVALFDETETYLRDTWQWDKLIDLVENAPAEAEPYMQYQLDAYFATQKLNKADELVASLDENSQLLPNYKVQCAAARGQREVVEQLLAESGYGASILDDPWFRSTVSKWDGFRDAFPPAKVPPVDPETLCLLAKPIQITEETLKSDLGEIEGLSFHRVGQHKGVDLWQFTIDDSYLMLLVGSEPYFEVDLDQDLASLPPADVEKIRQHKAWFAIVDQSGNAAPVFKREQFIGQVAKRLLTGAAEPDCVACGYSTRVSPFRPEFLSKLDAGQLDWLSFNVAHLHREVTPAGPAKDADELAATLDAGSDGVPCRYLWLPADFPVPLECMALENRERRIVIRFADASPCPIYLRGKKLVVPISFLERVDDVP